MADKPQFEIRQASRSVVKALVGFYGKSGSGKTMSALLFARGLAGPTGKVGIIDTENRRGSIFADLIPGGYHVLDLDAPFSPERYTDAIEAMEAFADVIVIDSMSHEWAGEGGVLDLHEEVLDRMTKGSTDWKERERLNYPAWNQPKTAHKMMVSRLLRCKPHLICCLRGEEKTHMAKEGGKNTVITDKLFSPLFDSKFIFELLLNFETVAHDGVGGFVIPRKITHRDVAKLLPGENEQISIKHGEALAALVRWHEQASISAGAGPPGGYRPTSPKTGIEAAKQKLWDVTKPVHGQTVETLESWLRISGIIATGQTVAAMTEPEILRIVELAQAELSKPPQDIIP